jgi:UDP-glucuronate 4-epimerase
MKILVTGSAGFIGSALCLRLLDLGYEIIGIDNHNDYYSPALKDARLSRHINNPKYIHERADISNKNMISNIFKKYKPQIVVNLAAQAGVRYSLKNPTSYINSNIVGFLNILEGCKNNNVEHLVYGSSSSVYGANTLLPYSVAQNTDHPLSLYAATKKSNELMAHSYSHLYKIPTTGLRFFTVYGPWDRPDMALQKFAHKIVKGETIKIFNYGNHQRDFTYIDDIIESIVRVINKPSIPNPNWSGKIPNPSSSTAPWRIYNIGNNQPEKLMDYIKALELALGKEAKKEMLTIQPGDVPNTWANVDELIKEFNYQPDTTIEKGINKFVEWFKDYYKV